MSPDNMEEKQDLIEYLKSLPDVEDTLPPFPEEAAAAEEPELSPAEQLANVIRQASARSRLVTKTQITQELEQGEVLLTAMAMMDSCKDIRSTAGKTETYYYSSQVMTDNYAMIATLVAEEDNPATLAQMVRFHAEKYPAATPFTYFYEHPYCWTPEQLALVLDQVKNTPAYADIVEVRAYDGTPFLISTRYVSEHYGKALADFGQESTESM